MTSDQWLREEFDRFDIAAPSAEVELRAVRRTVARRQRARRAAWIIAPLVVVLGAAAVLQVAQEDGPHVSSRPTPAGTRPLLIPSTLLPGMALVAAQGPSDGSGRSGDPTFEFRRTYVEFDVNRSRVERQLFVDVGRDAESLDWFERVPNAAAQVRGVPAKLWSDGVQSDLAWVDTTGLVLRVGGDIPADDAIAIAEGLTLEPARRDDARVVQLGTVPAGFEHFLDQKSVRETTGRGRYQLWYATPNRDATLQIDLQQFPTETVREQLLGEGAHVVDVRGQRGVFVDQAGRQRSLRWRERSGALVTLTATTLTEEQLRGIARGLRPIDDKQWRHLVRTTDPLGSRRSTNSSPTPTAARLDAIGPEMTAADGTIDGSSWQLVVYEVAPAPNQPERRFCYELRSRGPSSQSCFPLRTGGPQEKWLYAERHLGRWFLLGAADNGAPTELVDAQGNAVALQRFDDQAIPIQVHVAVLRDQFGGRFNIPESGWSSV